MSESKFYGTGRRKSSTARVFLAPGKGQIIVNGLPFKKYLCRETLATIVMQPLVAIESIKSYDIKVNVNGGGLTGQAGAIRHGISKALSLYDSSLRPPLKKVGFITRDPRVVERKKSGLAKARRSYQFSKR